MNAAQTVYDFPWLADYIFRECEKTNVVRLEKLEARVIREVSDYITKFPERIANRTLMRSRVRRHVAGYRADYSQSSETLFSAMSTAKDDEGKEAEYEPVDVLANVESEVVAKRTIDLLAQADRRKLVILNEWANGNTIDSDISLALAREIGGNPESHRKAIQRFRIECRNALECAAI